MWAHSGLFLLTQMSAPKPQKCVAEHKSSDQVDSVWRFDGFFFIVVGEGWNRIVNVFLCPANSPVVFPVQASIFEKIMTAETHFDVLELEKPFPDEINNPVWGVDGSMLKSQYRKFSLLTHPDKNQSSETAAEAFDKVRAAFSCLSDPTQRDQYLKDYLSKSAAKASHGWKPRNSGVEEELEEQVKRRKRTTELRGKEMASVRSRMMSRLKSRLAGSSAASSSSSQSSSSASSFTTTPANRSSFREMFDPQPDQQDTGNLSEASLSSDSDDSDDSSKERSVRKQRKPTKKRMKSRLF